MLSSTSAKKPKRKRPSGAINRTPWQGWVRFRQVPFSEGFTRKMIDAGIFVSALVQEPGSRRGVRLIEAASIDRYLQQLAKEQQRFAAVTRTSATETDDSY